MKLFGLNLVVVLIGFPLLLIYLFILVVRRPFGGVYTKGTGFLIPHTDPQSIVFLKICC